MRKKGFMKTRRILACVLAVALMASDITIPVMASETETPASETMEAAESAQSETAQTEAVQTEASKQTEAAQTEAPKQTETAQTEAPKQTEAVQTEAPKQTEAVQTEAPKQTEAAQSETTAQTETAQSETASAETSSAETAQSESAAATGAADVTEADGSPESGEAKNGSDDGRSTEEQETEESLTESDQAQETKSETETETKIETEEHIPAGIRLTETEKDGDEEDERRVRLEAAGASDTDVEVRLYFWDFDGSLPADKDSWAAALTDVCEDIEIEGYDKDKNELILPVILEDGTSECRAQYVLERAETAEKQVIAAYISFVLPANASMDTDLVFTLREDTVSERIEAVLLPDETEEQTEEQMEDEHLLIESVFVYPAEDKEQEEAEPQNALKLVWELTAEDVAEYRAEKAAAANASDGAADADDTAGAESIGDTDAAGNAADDVSDETDADTSDENAGEAADPAVSFMTEEAILSKEAAYSWYTVETADASENGTSSEEEDNAGIALASVEEENTGIALASVEEENTGISLASEEPSVWGYSITYVGESSAEYDEDNNSYSVEKTDNFMLEYQINFNTSEDLEAGAVQIRIPAALLTLRDGTEVTPSDIGVPEGTPEDYKETKVSPFNYYYETDENGDETGYIIFWNYKDITSGTKASVQILYPEVDVMYVVDGTTWELPSTATVTRTVGTGEEITTVKESIDGATLKGSVDTGVTLDSVTKTAYQASSATAAYTPGLYTEKQVLSYISASSLPELFSGDNFNDYKYVVWRVTVKGSATQLWTLTTEDSTTITRTATDPDSGEVTTTTTGIDGIVVGYKNIYSNRAQVDANGEITYDNAEDDRTILADYYMVVAYKADEVTETDVLTNTVTVTVSEYDSLTPDPDDPDKPAVSYTKSDDASWSYQNYEWKYEGDLIGITKWANQTNFSAYLDVYRNNQESQKDTGVFSYTTSSICHGYEFTHNTSGDTQVGVGNSTNYAEYVANTYYELTTVDDALYAYPNGTNGIMLTEDDYYFSSVTIKQTDYGLDYWESTLAAPERISNLDETDRPKDANGNAVTQDLYIYAMFADSTGNADEDGWELVDTISWDDYAVTGSASEYVTYSFSSEALAKQPYRVKVVHATINNYTTCNITVGVTLRYDSPTIAYLQDTVEDLSSLKIENVSGVSGWYQSSCAWVVGSKEADAATAKENGYTGAGNDGNAYMGYIQDETDTNYNSYSNQTILDQTLSATEIWSLEDYTKNTYDTILESGRHPNADFALLMRDNAYVTLTGLTPRANSYKTATSQNDPDNARVLVNYILTAYESYEVSDTDTITLLKNMGITLPDRSSGVVYYDLLPYGMKYDATVEPTAGRILSLSSTAYQTNTRAWDTSGVSVTVSAEDIQENWNGTGRTLVAFHISYDGTDAGSYSYINNNVSLWFKGWGVSFQAYYDWADLDTCQAEYNICAFTPETEDTEAICGTAAQVDVEGDISSVSSAETKTYSPFADADLNGDGTVNNTLDEAEQIRNVLYAKAIAPLRIAQASQGGITKLVRADADVVSEYTTATAVDYEGYYTYEITVSNGEAEMNDIVIFDTLEQAWQDERYTVETSSGLFIGADNEPESYQPWAGTFVEVLTDAILSEYNVEAKVYYNADSDAATPVSGETTQTIDRIQNEVLTEENGWIPAEEWLTTEKTAGSGEYFTLADVKAIALDLSTTADGNEFVLEAGESISIKIRMQAPSAAEAAAYGAYTYNNPSFYSKETNGSLVTLETTIGDSVRVELGGTGSLIVQKEFEGEIPSSFEDEAFTFTLTKADGSVISYQQYTLETLQDDGTWKASTVLRTTDVNGQFTLTAGQRAVFTSLADYEDVQATEEESVFWETTYEDSQETGDTPEEADREIVVSNAYRPILYARKSLEYTSYADTDLYMFELQLQIKNDSGEWENASGAEFVYVTGVASAGVSPTVDTMQGNNGYGTLDADGKVVLAAGQYIAIYAGSIGTEYRLAETAVLKKTWVGTDVEGADDEGYVWVRTELSADETDWVSVKAEAAGTLTASNATATITNRYKYRDLYLTKQITYQDADECTQEFTFTIKDEDGSAVNGLYWEVVDASGEAVLDENGNVICGYSGYTTYSTNEHGDPVLTASGNGYAGDGSITCAVAGTDRRLRIVGLTAGETYTITETETGDDYEAVTGTKDVYINVYSNSVSTSMTNEYLRKSLSVSKVVIYENKENSSAVTEAVNSTEFTMQLYKWDDDIGTAGEWVAQTDIPYTVNGEAADENDDPYQTDDKGRFTIKNGQTIVFTDIGYEEDQYKIIELLDANSTYKQVYPEVTTDGSNDDGAAYVTLEDSGGAVTFLNGEEGLMLSKQYVGLDEAASAYASILENGLDGAGVTDESMTATSEAQITMLLYVKKAGSTGYSLWPDDDDGDVTVYVVGADGSYAQKTWSAGEGLSVYPWERVFILGLDNLGLTGADYILTEEEDEQLRLLTLQSTVKTAVAKTTGMTAPSDLLSELQAEVSGNTDTDKSAVIVNELSSANKASEIYKEMAVNSASVEEGAKLVLRVERYSESDGTWSPASGIAYLTMDGAGVTDVVRSTGENGLITLYKSANGYPYVRFTEDEVYVNVYGSDVPDGTLRVVELLELSDSGWGILTGYANLAEGDLYDISTTWADTIVNSTDTSQQLEVAKYVEDAQEGDTFTFYLQEVISASAYPVTEESQILASQAVSGISYTVYELETDEELYTGTTGNNGSFTLEAGQYARFSVPDGTIWKIYEGVTSGYELTDVTVRDEDGVLTLLGEGETLALYQGGTVETDGEKVITQEDVANGIYGLYGNAITLNTGDVVIPAYVTETSTEEVDGVTVTTTKILKVVGIGENAFRGNQSITSLKIADTVRFIGDSAFESCIGLTGDLTIPETVTSIGASAFAYCTGFDGTLTIEEPDGAGDYANGYLYTVTIGDRAFYGCSGFTGKLTIPCTVGSIGEAAFYGNAAVTSLEFEMCNDLLSMTRSYFQNGNSDSSAFDGNYTYDEAYCKVTIGNGAFYGCTSLQGDLLIPPSVRSVGSGAFGGTYLYDRAGWLYVLSQSVGTEGGVGSGYAVFDPNSSWDGIFIGGFMEEIKDSSFWRVSVPSGPVIIEASKDRKIAIGIFAFYTSNMRYLLLCGEEKASIDIESDGPCLTYTYAGGVVSIGNNAFCGCTSLLSGDSYNSTDGNLYIPASVTSLGDYIVADDTSLNGKLTVMSGAIGTSTFSGAYFTSLELGDFGTYTRWYSSSVPIPESLGIGSGYRVRNVTKSNLPSGGVTSIGYQAFSSGNFRGSLTGTLTIPSSVTSIGTSAFAGQSSLTGVTFAESQYAYELVNGSIRCPLDIGKQAFVSCGISGTLTIPARVTSIGDQAFWDCPVSALELMDTSEYANTSGGKKIVADNLTIGQVILGPGNTSFTGTITIPSRTTSIGSNAFVGLVYASGLEILGGDAGLSIGSGAFSGFGSASSETEGISALTIPERVESIGENAFSGATFASITVNQSDADVRAALKANAPWGYAYGSVTWDPDDE